MNECIQKRLTIVLSILIAIGIIIIAKKHKEHVLQTKREAIEKEWKKVNDLFIETEKSMKTLK